MSADVSNRKEAKEVFADLLTILTHEEIDILIYFLSEMRAAKEKQQYKVVEAGFKDGIFHQVRSLETVRTILSTGNAEIM